VTAATKQKIERDLDQLLAAWDAACPEAKRFFAEGHFCLDGWPAAVPLSDEAFAGERWTRK
jgi:hypothetical protein